MLKSAIVVGGGLGGAAVAASLAKIGLKVTLYERSRELREIGAGIFIKTNGLEVLDRLGVYDAAVTLGTWILKGELWDKSARKFVDRLLPDRKVMVIKRADLHGILIGVAVAAGVTVKTDNAVSGATLDGVLTLEDGSKVQAELVVGADGIGSAVRDSLRLNEYVRHTGNGSWRALVPREKNDPTAKVIEFWRGHRRVLVTQSGQDATYLCASCRNDDNEAAPDTFDAKVWSRHFPEFADLIGRVNPELTTFRHHTKVRVKAWRKGVVAILGDAVHGQPPNLGQGAGCAIANAGALAVALRAQPDVETALLVWEREQRALTEQIQSFSNRYDDVVHSWPLYLEGARTAFVSAFGAFKPTRLKWARLSAGVKQI